MNPIYCFNITTRDDSINFYSSIIVELSLTSQPNLAMYGVLLPDVLSIEILDDDGMALYTYYIKDPCICMPTCNFCILHVVMHACITVTATILLLYTCHIG